MESNVTNISGFEALGHQGSKHFKGLEVFPNPGVKMVHMETDEFTSLCPVTGQPDYYIIRVAYEETEWCIESKSMKLYLVQYRTEGHFAEALAVKIKEDVVEALEGPNNQDIVLTDNVTVVVTQKPRGGIEIEAVA